jgi:DHA1 family multidrug resistance protein-like MFS transporter
MVVIMMGFGIIIPIMPFYVEHFGAGGSELGMLMSVYALMQFFFAPVWGQVSDRYGRKPVLLVGVIGNMFSMLFFGLSTSLGMLFASRALAGILSSATLPTAMAYIGDSTSQEDRGGGMGVIGAAMGVGVVIGPGLGGWLSSISLAAPFFAAAGLSLLTALLVLLLLPESLPESARDHSGGRIRGVQLGGMWRALFGPIGLLLILALLMSFGLTNFEGIFSLYAKEHFDYGPERVASIMVVIGIASALMQGVLTGPLARRWGEVALIRASLLLSAVGFVLMLLAQDFVGVLLTVSFFVVSNAMLRPAVTALTSKRTVQGQGVAMGLSNAFMSLGRIIGPTWAGFVFEANMSYPYTSGAIIMFVAFVASMIWLKREVGAAAPSPPIAQDMDPAATELPAR